jgi:fibronectin type 3 domain-containing protein
MRAKILATLLVFGMAACNSSTGGGDVPTVPTAPTAVQATPGNQQVSISWTNSSGATSYNLYWSTTSGVTPVNGTKITSATKPYVHTGLTNGTQYYYVATAVNATGESVASSQVTAIPATNPPPAAPTGVQATPGNQQVSVSWTNVSGATSYNVYWSTTAGVTPSSGTQIPGAANPYVHTGRANGTPYYYVVTAVNANGESTASLQVIATPSAAPFISAFVLSTPGGAIPAFGFLEQAQVCTDATCNTPVSTATVTVNGNALTYDATRHQYTGVHVIAAGAAVTLQVTIGGIVYSGSGTQYATAPTVTAPTSGATWQGANANAITWTGVASPPSGSSYVLGIMNGSGDFLYPVSSGGRGGPKEVTTGTTSDSVPAGTLSAGSYEVMLGIATSGIAGGGSGGIAIANAAAGSGLWVGLIAPLVPVTVQSASPPSAPTGVQATPGNAQVTVSWSNVSGATSYNVYWSVTSGVTIANGTKIANATSPYVHSGRTNGTQYYYVVTAQNAIGESVASGQVSATPAPNPPPAAPTGVQATPGNTQVSVSWTSVSGATSYNLYWSVTSPVTLSSGTKVTGVNSPHFQTSLANGTRYYFVVTAVNGNGESGASSEVSATPSAAPYIAAFVLSTPGGAVPPFGFLEQAQVCTDATCNTPVSTATVTVNGNALTYDATRHQYTGTHVIAAGAAVTLQVTIGGTLYTGSGTQYATAPTVTAPASGATWQGADANTISWTGVASPPSGSSYVLGVMDGTGNFVYPVSSGGRGGPKEVTIGTTSDTISAGILPAGSFEVMLGIATSGIAGGGSGGIPIANTAAGSGLWVGLIAPLVPITVQAASPPVAPTGVQATPGNQQVTVAWTNVSGATSYNVYWSQTSPVTLSSTKVTGATNPYVQTGRTNGTPYYYVVTAVNGNGESGASSQVTATPASSNAPYIYASVLSMADGSTPPFGFTESVQVYANSSRTNPISTATVTVNGNAIPWDAGRSEYRATHLIAPGATVTLQVVVNSVTYTGTGAQYSTAPVITVPASPWIWLASAANTISWTGGSPTTNATYVAGVLDGGTGNFVFPRPDPGGGGGPMEVAIGTNSVTVPAATITATGPYLVMTGIGTTGIVQNNSGGIVIPSAAAGSGLWLGLITPFQPITVQ